MKIIHIFICLYSNFFVHKRNTSIAVMAFGKFITTTMPARLNRFVNSISAIHQTTLFIVSTPILWSRPLQGSHKQPQRTNHRMMLEHCETSAQFGLALHNRDVSSAVFRDKTLQWRRGFRIQNCDPVSSNIKQCCVFKNITSQQLHIYK